MYLCLYHYLLLLCECVPLCSIRPTANGHGEPSAVARAPRGPVGAAPRGGRARTLTRKALSKADLRVAAVYTSETTGTARSSC